MLVSCITRHYRKVLNLICCVAFSIQFFNVVKEWLYPTQTTVEIKEIGLENFDFPVIFKICANPGFNITVLQEEGYDSINAYFCGTSKFNSSITGWAGHNNGTSCRKSVEGKIS